MKLKIQSLFLTLTLAAVIFSCKDDDKGEKKLSNAYIFDGTKKSIKAASFEDNTHDEGGGYSFFFSPTTAAEDSEDGPNEYIEIDIPKERMGAKFELTEEELYDWGWWFEFTNNEAEMTYEGFGAEGEMENIKSGTMSAIKTGDGTFTIEIDLVFTDDKTFKLNFSGEMTNDDEGPSRVSTHVKANNSPNN